MCNPRIFPIYIKIIKEDINVKKTATIRNQVVEYLNILNAIIPDAKIRTNPTVKYTLRPPTHKRISIRNSRRYMASSNPIIFTVLFNYCIA